MQAFDTFKRDSSSLVTKIDFVTAPFASSPRSVTVAIVPLSGSKPDLLATPVYRQTFLPTDYTMTTVDHSSGPDSEIISSMPLGLMLAAGSYDITFYGSSLSVDDFRNRPMARQYGYSLYQTGIGFRTGYSLGFDLIGTPVAASEPGSMLLLGTGLAGLAASFRRRTVGSAAAIRPSSVRAACPGRL